MEKEFKAYIKKRLGDWLGLSGRFKIDRKLNLGANRPGSCVWRWRVSESLSCFVALEFYTSGFDAGLGVGWTKRKGGQIDFSAADEATRLALRQRGIESGGLDELDEVYVHRSAFGFVNDFFGPIDFLASVERAKLVYSSPDALRAVDELAVFSEIDWERSVGYRMWGVIKCVMDTALSDEDAEYATGKVCMEMIEFLDGRGLPLLSEVASSFT